MSTTIQSRPRYPSLTIRMEFESLKAGANAVTDAIVAAHKSFKVKNGNAQYWAALCRKAREKACEFKVVSSVSPSLSEFTNNLGANCVYQQQP
jgi:hypothetical protein